MSITESFIEPTEELQVKNDDDGSADDNIENGIAKMVVREVRQEIDLESEEHEDFQEELEDKKSDDQENLDESMEKDQDSEDKEDSIDEEKPTYSTPLKNGWFTQITKGKEIKVQEIFGNFSENTDYISIKDLPTLFQSITSELRLEIFDYHKEIFKKIYESLHPIKTIQKPKKKPKTIYPVISFSDFNDLMNLWGEKYTKEQEKVRGNLMKTIKQYQDLKSSNQNFSQMSSILESLTKSLELFFYKDLETHKEETTLKSNYKKNLEDIFQFYAKVQRIQGTDDTFESMEASNNAWNLGKFLKFCTDFKIIQGKNDGERVLNKEQLVSIFKRTANNTRLMSEQQFLDSLDKIAEVLYSPELDKALNTNLAYLPIDQKKENLYKLLGIHDFNIYYHKKKAFGIAFSPEKYSRIPLSESSHQYKFKINESSQKKLEGWKKTKPNRETPPLKPIKENAKNSVPFIRKSVKNLPGSGYALRLKAKKNQDDKTEEKIILNEESSSKEVQNNESQPKILTIKALTNMEYKDIDDEFGFKDLISEDSDEFFDKLYGIEPKLQGIMKMHDEKLARGKKVVEKNKYAYSRNNIS
jgi:hypothetical protein